MIYSDSTFLIWQKGPRFGRYHSVGLRGNNYICFTVQLRHWIILQRDFSTFIIYICELLQLISTCMICLYRQTDVCSCKLFSPCNDLLMCSAVACLSTPDRWIWFCLHVTLVSSELNTFSNMCVHSNWGHSIMLALIVRVITPSGISSGVIMLLRDELWKMR